MPRIAAVTARQILDSRGVPTVEATVQLDNGIIATSSAPSGSVSNKEEAIELRDHVSQEYFGLGVSKAVENVQTVINEKLVGQDPLYQTQIDQMLVDLDGTTNKNRLGSNAILATSQAVIKAAAASLRLPLFIYVKEKYQLIQSYRIPTPIFNLMNGGRHGSGTLDFQEFQLVPASHLPYNQALRIGVEMFMALDRVLEQKGAIRTVGVEGGYSPNLATNTDALEIFSEAIKLTQYTLAKDCFLGLDVTPKWFFKNGKYTVKDRPQPMAGKQLVKFYQDLHHQYRVFSFEDPLMADAWGDWKFMTAEMGKTAMITADDLVTTNKTLLMKAIQEQACNALVIKPNRVGTVTEAIEIANLAKQAGWHTIMSHRSGETTDDILADIAVGIGTDYVKFGAPSRGERVEKYNRLLRIEEILLRSKQEQQSTSQGESNMADTTSTLGATPVAPMPVTTPTATPVSGPTLSSVFGGAAAPASTPTPMTSTPTPAASVVNASQPQVLPMTPVTADSTAPVVSATPSLAPTPMPGMSEMPAPLSASPAPVAPPAPMTAPTQEIKELQSDLDELAKMVTPGAPVAPSPVVSTPTPAIAGLSGDQMVGPGMNTLSMTAPTPTPASAMPPSNTPATGGMNTLSMDTPAVAPVAAGPAGLRPPMPPATDA
jgi:enolase